MGDSQISSLLTPVIQIAHRAGIFLLDHHHKMTSIEYDRRDVKTDADRKAEDLILNDLRGLADFPMLSEERGMVESQSSSDYVWIVDPLDGTMNYVRGIPGSCVSIALWRADTPVFGVIYSFHNNEMFSGVVGEGAWLAGQPIRVSETEDAKSAILLTGFPIGAEFDEQAVARFVRHVTRFRKIRMIGSAALSLAYVAAGRGDAYYERHIRTWDVAAGLAIVLAAGGRIQTTPTGKPQSLIVYAGNARIEPLG